MKLSFILFILLSLQNGAYAQKEPQEYFDEGLAYVEKGDYKSAITAFKYIVENYPDYGGYGMALYNTAYTYGLAEDYDGAISYFKKILASDLDETEKIGGSIMSSPYANYKHKACNGLCSIYIMREDYKKALEYHIMSDEKYPYLHFCATEGCGNEFSLASRYGFLYEKIGQKDKAIDKLLRYALSKRNDIILEALKPLLSEKKDVKATLDKAIENRINRKQKNINRYYINFLGTELFIGEQEEIENPQIIIDEFKATAFYKMVEAI